jgi:hypothetical protein
MYLRKTWTCFIFLQLIALTSSAQRELFSFQKDDTAIKGNLYREALADKNNLIKSLGKEYRNDYKEWYESRFETAGDLLKSKTFISEPAAHKYLQGLLQKIVAANPELKDLKIRMVFTREGWANAFSIGEGTLALNAGLFIHLDNEAQLVFVLCHEVSHLYLDHSNKEIKKRIEILHDDKLKKEFKELSKQKYKVGEKLDQIIKRYAFGIFRHSREDEREADACAFRFMKNTGFDCNQMITCLQLLDKLNDSTDLNTVDLKQVFSFSEYRFKDKWISSETSIFSAMSDKDQSSLTKAERDSLKTHPDIPERISLVEKRISEAPPGKSFLVDEQMFHALQKQFIAEIVEQVFEYKNLTGHLYLAMQLLDKEGYRDYAAYAVLRCLNLLYRHQKDHTLGTVTDKETRYYDKKYNLLLRMIDRLKLDEIADLSFQFAKKYNHLSVYKEFADEMRIAQENKSAN